MDKSINSINHQKLCSYKQQYYPQYGKITAEIEKICAAFQLNVKKIELFLNKLEYRNQEFEDIFKNKIKDNDTINHYGEELQNYEKIIVVAAGGSLITPQAVVSILQHTIKKNPHEIKKDKPQIIFIENTDQDYINTILLSQSWKNTAIISISKSNNSLETFAIVRYILSKLHDQNHCTWFHIGNSIPTAEQSLGYSQPQVFIPYHEEVSGRFAPFSTPSLLLAVTIGADVDTFCRGGELALSEIKNNQYANKEKYQWQKGNYDAFQNKYNDIEGEENPLVNGIAEIIFSLQEGWSEVYLSSCKAISLFNRWRSTVYIESLGKLPQYWVDSRSMDLPYAQHTYLQSYISAKNQNIIKICIPTWKNNVEYVVDYNLDLINNTAYDVISTQLLSKNIPLVIEKIPVDNPLHIGYLFAHYMIRVIVAGAIMGFNALRQETVDQIKNQIFCAFFKANKN